MARWFDSHGSSLAFLVGGGFASLGAAACTFGNVTDAATGATIPGVTLSFQAVDMRTPVTRKATSVAFTGSPIQSRTWSPLDPSPHAGFDGTYWLNPYAPEYPADNTPLIVSSGWNRITLSVPGYDTAYIYRNHQYVPTSVQTVVPYSAGPYSVPPGLTVTSGVASGTVAAEEDFSMFRAPVRDLTGRLFWSSIIESSRT